MRKVSFSITNDKGFILLHVLFIISLLFIIVSYGVSSYRNEVYITQRQVEQITVESIFQMARESYKRDLATSEEIINNITYEFPQGGTDISILSANDSYLKLSFKIYFPDEPVKFFTLNHLLALE